MVVVLGSNKRCTSLNKRSVQWCNPKPNHNGAKKKELCESEAGDSVGLGGEGGGERSSLRRRCRVRDVVQRWGCRVLRSDVEV
jgi:hypothetical protein